MSWVIGFLGGKTGTGTTTFVYHLAWLYAEQGYRVLAVDLDPQPTLSTRMVDEDRVAALWRSQRPTLSSSLEGEVGQEEYDDPSRQSVTTNLELLVGDPFLTAWESHLARSWELCVDGNESGFHFTLSLQRLIQRAARSAQAEVVLVDLAPNASAINRAALLACDNLVMLATTDLISSYSFPGLARRVKEWRSDWHQFPVDRRALHEAFARPAGYLLREQPSRFDRPEIEWGYADALVGKEPSSEGEAASRLGTVSWYGSVLPMAEEARKPIFRLKPADGALGAHARMVREARRNFEDIADRIAAATWKSEAHEHR